MVSFSLVVTSSFSLRTYVYQFHVSYTHTYSFYFHCPLPATQPRPYHFMPETVELLVSQSHSIPPSCFPSCNSKWRSKEVNGRESNLTALGQVSPNPEKESKCVLCWVCKGRIGAALWRVLNGRRGQEATTLPLKIHVPHFHKTHHQMQPDELEVQG